MTDPLPDELSEAERARQALIQWYSDAGIQPFA